MPALREFARDQLALAEQKGLRRRLVETERIGPGMEKRSNSRRPLASVFLNCVSSFASSSRIRSAACSINGYCCA